MTLLRKVPARGESCTCALVGMILIISTSAQVENRMLKIVSNNELRL